MALPVGGEWTLDGAVVAGGMATAEVEVDLGALSVLHMAVGRGKSGGVGGTSGKGKATAQGPGKWKRKRPTNLSERALDSKTFKGNSRISATVQHQAARL